MHGTRNGISYRGFSAHNPTPTCQKEDMYTTVKQRMLTKSHTSPRSSVVRARSVDFLEPAKWKRLVTIARSTVRIRAGTDGQYLFGYLFFLLGEGGGGGWRYFGQLPNCKGLDFSCLWQRTPYPGTRCGISAQRSNANSGRNWTVFCFVRG